MGEFQKLYTDFIYYIAGRKKLKSTILTKSRQANQARIENNQTLAPMFLLFASGYPNEDYADKSTKDNG